MSVSHDAASRFLAEEFPGLRLHAVTSRAEKWPSLRFELGGDIPNEMADERVSQAVERASAIFEAAFSPEDEGFLSFTRWWETDDPLVLPLLPAACETIRIEGEDFYEEGERDAPHVTYSATLRPRSLDYRRIFDLIASSDLGRSPSIGGRAYLLNASTPLILHMYDDRGAMLVASNERALAELRTRFAEWITRSPPRVPLRSGCMRNTRAAQRCDARRTGKRLASAPGSPNSRYLRSAAMASS
jgi:hypothetical protein